MEVVSWALRARSQPRPRSRGQVRCRRPPAAFPSARRHPHLSSHRELRISPRASPWIMAIPPSLRRRPLPELNSPAQSATRRWYVLLPTLLCSASVGIYDTDCVKVTLLQLNRYTSTPTTPKPRAHRSLTSRQTPRRHPQKPRR